MSLEVSVVVPTHDRPEGLAAVLAALRAQTLAPAAFEVLVVDDGSWPPAEGGGSGARVLRHETGRGPAAARNTGWRAARAPLVAFVDDDCVPVPGWLEALIAVAAGDDAAVVQGPVGPPPGSPPGRGPLDHVVEVGGPSRLFVSANIAYARALLERTGGFDEGFLRACAEDVELGARALRAGAEVRWAPGAVVHHPVRPLGLAGALRQAAKWTDAARALRLAPELRELLTARVFWRPSHPLLLLALAGAATRRPLPAAVAAAPYVRHRLRHGAGPRWLPAEAVLDLWEVGVAAAGGVRHRTPFL